jgi:hypothetical protein
VDGKTVRTHTEVDTGGNQQIYVNIYGGAVPETDNTTDLGIDYSSVPNAALDFYLYVPDPAVFTTGLGSVHIEFGFHGGRSTAIRTNPLDGAGQVNADKLRWSAGSLYGDQGAAVSGLGLAAGWNRLVLKLAPASKTGTYAATDTNLTMFFVWTAGTGGFAIAAPKLIDGSAYPNDTNRVAVPPPAPVGEIDLLPRASYYAPATDSRVPAGKEGVSFNQAYQSEYGQYKLWIDLYGGAVPETDNLTDAGIDPSGVADPALDFYLYVPDASALLSDALEFGFRGGRMTDIRNSPFDSAAAEYDNKLIWYQAQSVLMGLSFANGWNHLTLKFSTAHRTLAYGDYGRTELTMFYLWSMGTGRLSVYGLRIVDGTSLPEDAIAAPAAGKTFSSLALSNARAHGGSASAFVPDGQDGVSYAMRGISPSQNGCSSQLYMNLYTGALPSGEMPAAAVAGVDYSVVPNPELDFWLYIDDLSDFNAFGAVEFGFTWGRRLDLSDPWDWNVVDNNNKIRWDKGAFGGLNLVAGWNHVALKFSAASKAGNLYAAGSTELTMFYWWADGRPVELAVYGLRIADGASHGSSVTLLETQAKPAPKSVEIDMDASRKNAAAPEYDAFAPFGYDKSMDMSVGSGRINNDLYFDKVFDVSGYNPAKLQIGFWLFVGDAGSLFATYHGAPQKLFGFVVFDESRTASGYYKWFEAHEVAQFISGWNYVQCALTPLALNSPDPAQLTHIRLQLSDESDSYRACKFLMAGVKFFEAAPQAGRVVTDYIPLAEGVALANVTVKVGEIADIPVIFPNPYTMSPLVWTTSDRSIAAVSPEGQVKGKTPGAVVVTASYNGMTGYCLITVEGEGGSGPINGKDGAKGDKGDEGLPGQDGLPGAKGDTGNDGLPGANGQNGLDGKDGLNGCGKAVSAFGLLVFLGAAFLVGKKTF